jgi:hypothetical protein
MSNEAKESPSNSEHTSQAKASEPSFATLPEPQRKLRTFALPFNGEPAG